jgi:hypothetical protein
MECPFHIVNEAICDIYKKMKDEKSKIKDEEASVQSVRIRAFKTPGPRI